MLASRLKGRKVLLIDANETAGKKLRISGGGKCNVTNETVTPHNYLGDAHFIAPALIAFDQQDTLAYFARHGVHPKIRSRGQYFCTRSAQEILDVFAKESAYAVRRFGTKILGVSKDKSTFTVRTDKGEFHAALVVVATGGMSYPSIGASDIGMKIAEGFGHGIVPPRPALVGLTVQREQFWFKELSGISFPAGFWIGERYFEDELLFAHKGISGPVVLNASLYWEKGSMRIDFLPGKEIRKLLGKSNKQLSTLIPLPKRFMKGFLEAVGLEDKAADRLNDSEKKLLMQLHDYTFSPAGHFGYTKAEAMKGGVSTEDIDPDTMESRKVEGLYFIGEVMDVTGELGGYNFQWAFSSAHCAARAIQR